MTILELPPVTAPLLDHALAYAHHGLEVFPAEAATKAPLTRKGMYDATTDLDQIRAWWERHPTALIAHRITPGVLLTDIDPRHDGHATWKALADEIGDTWPHTRAHLSGRGDGGGHAWWQHPGVDLSTGPLDQWARERGVGEELPNGRWSAGIDLLHNTLRYTILPPSPHPETGQPYQWSAGRGLDHPVAPMPPLLAELITKPAPAPAPTKGTLLAASLTEDSIAQWATDHLTWTQLLQPHGWVLVEGDGDRDGSRWRHPQATNTWSATIKHGQLFVHSPRTVFEPTAPGEPHGYTRFRAYAVLNHDGNLSAAASQLRELKDGPRRTTSSDQLRALAGDTSAPSSNGHGPDHSNGISDQAAAIADTLESWSPIDLGPVLAGDHEQPAPTLLTSRDGAHHYLYPGKVNGLHGDSGIGKSWIAYAAAAQQLQNGNRVLIVDYEATATEVVSRLRALTVPDQRILEQLTYLQPNAPTGTLAVAQLVELIHPDTTLVIIDSLGEAFGLDGIDENSDAEVGPWLRRVARPIAEAGPAVLLIDHGTKAADNPLHPSGSKRKRAAIPGASYLVTAKTTPTRDSAGELHLTCAKDRHGTYPRGAIVATVDITPYPDGGVTINLHKPPTAIPEATSEAIARAAVRALREHGRPATKNELIGLMTVKGRKDQKLAGIAVAISRGAINVEAGPNRAQLHRYIKDLPDAPGGDLRTLAGETG